MSTFIYFAGKFTNPEKRSQYLKNYLLFLYAGGFDYMRVSNQADFPEAMSEPLLALFSPGTTLDFSASNQRENWSIVFDMSDLVCDSKNGQCLIHQVPLQPFIQLSGEQLEKLRGLFDQVCRYSSAGHLAGAEKAKLLLGALLTELIADSSEKTIVSPAAAALKEAIDKDVHFRQSIGEMATQLRMGSLPYLRKLFLAEYGMLPNEYRARQRMNRILELFSRTDDSLKMIADEVGMKHLQHLYLFLKERQQLSPKELLLQFRGRKL